MKLSKWLVTATLAVAVAGNAWAQQTTLRIFTGGQQRPDVMRKIADEYTKRNPAVKVEVEVGVLRPRRSSSTCRRCSSSKDSALDLVLIDIIRPAQWAAQGWAEPLDGYLGADKAKILPTYIKAYVEANQVNGKLMALPYFADSQFLYYRKDLLEKYKRAGAQDLGRDDGGRQADHGRREEPAAAGLLDGRRADRRHGLHVPRAATGAGAAT